VRLHRRFLTRVRTEIACVVVDGVRFDVQWRLEGNDGSILQSDCFTVTVK
jgi:hypothetical protein